jgi:hypothetical protein
MKCNSAQVRVTGIPCHSPRRASADGRGERRPELLPPRPRRRQQRLALAACAAAAAAVTLLDQRSASAQTIWNGGTGNWNTAANWSTGTFPNGSTTNVLIDNGNAAASTVTLNTTVSVNNLTIDAGDALLYQIGQQLSVYGNATINGILDTSNGGAGYGYLYFQGTNTHTLGGSGVINFGTASGNYSYVYESSTNVLTIGPGLLIHGRYAQFSDQSGAGFLNQGTIAADVAGGTWYLTHLTNQGSIQALNGGTLNAQNLVNAAGGTVTVNAATLTLDGTNWRNLGTINSTNGTVNLGGTFSFTNVGTFNRSGGRVNVTGTLLNGGNTLSLNATTGPWILTGGTIRGGTIATGGAPLLLDSGTLDGVAIAPNSVTFNRPGATLDIYNGLTLTGGAVLDLGNGTNNFYGYLYFRGTNAQTLGGSGVINFGTNATSSYLYQYSTNVATIGPGILIHGKNGYLSDQNGAGFLSQGTIAADVGGGTWNLYHVTNQGTIQSLNGATLYTQNLTNAPGGTVTVNASTLTLDGTNWSNLGTINATNGTVKLDGTFSFSSLANFNRTGGNVFLTGTLLNGGNTLPLNATTGSWIIDGGTIRGGTVSASAPAQLLVNTGTLDGVTLDTGATGFAFNKTSAQLTVQNGLTLLNGSIFDVGGGTSGFYGTIYFQGSNAQTLGGNGQLNFGTSSSSSTLYNYNNTNTLTIGPGILIHGKNGQLIDNSTGNRGFLLQGTVSADVAGGSFTLNNFTNTALLQAINGGSLHLTGTYWHNAGTINAGANSLVELGGPFHTSDIGSVTRGPGSTVTISGNLTNTGSTLALDAISGSFVLDGGTIHGGTIAAGGGAQFLLNSGTLDGVTMNTGAGGLAFNQNAVNLIIQNGLTLANGSVLDEARGTNHFYGTLNFTGTNVQTLGGNGQINFGSNTTYSYLYSYQTTNTVTIGPGILVHGKYGQLNNNSSGGGFINNGTIAADIAGGQFYLYNITNNGSIQALNGGVVNMTGNNWHNTGGTITAGAGSLVDLGGNFFTADVGSVTRGPGSTVTISGNLTNTAATLALNATTGSFLLTGGGTIHGGTVTTSGGAQLLVNSGTLDGVSLNGASLAFHQNGATLTLQNGLPLANGTLIDTAGGTNGFYGTIYVTGTNSQGLKGSGEINLGSNNASYTYIYNYNNTNALTIDPGILIHGKYGQLINYPTATNGGFINQGTISAEVAGGTFYLYGNFTNQGTVQAINGGSLNLSTSNFIQTAGLLASGVDVPTTGLIQISGGSVSIGGSLGYFSSGTVVVGLATPGPTVTVNVGSIYQNSLTIHNTGLLKVSVSTNRVTSMLNALTIEGNGLMDLGNKGLQVNNVATPEATVRQYLINGYNADPSSGIGDWNGKGGFTSADAIASHNGPNPNFRVSVGYVNGAYANDPLIGGSIPGQPLPTNRILVRPALYGDFNLDGKVDDTDLAIFSGLGQYNKPTDKFGWLGGDLNHDGKVDDTDLLIFSGAGNYNSPAYAPSPAGSASANPSAGPTLTGHVDAASGDIVLSAATSQGTIGDGILDFIYDPGTGDMKVFYDGDSRITAANPLQVIRFKSAGGHFIPANFNGSGFSNTTTDNSTLNGTILGGGSLPDGYDLGHILPTGLLMPDLISDLTLQWNVSGGGLSLKNGDIVPEPGALGLVGLSLAGRLLRRRRRRRCHGSRASGAGS